MFDSNRLHGELAQIHGALGTVAASPRGKGMLGELRRVTRGTNAARLWQALHADCLRVTYAAVAADGAIGDEEIEALHHLLSAAARSYAETVPALYGEFSAIDRAGARAFLERYAGDDGPFGRRAPVLWPGLALCRRASEIGEGAALAQYEATMTWLIAEACRIAGVTGADLRGRGRLEELDELRRSLARHAVVDAPGVDLRVQAFLSPTWVFTAVQQASSIFENDPFDIESIHRHARDSFEQLIESARMPQQIAGGGRMLLVLGDSGGGKTHLLRGFRHQVQEYGRGFVVYAQLQSNSTDYERYLLQHFVDSLSRPYSAASGERTGLRELAHGVVRLASAAVQARVQVLVEGSWTGSEGITQYVNELVDDLLREGRLGTFDRDLLRVMLYALFPDPCVTASVYRYLRCEDMNPHDLKWIGQVIPRTRSDHPHTMFRELGRLAALTQRALIVMVDQVDLTGLEQFSSTVFRRAIDALYRITSEVSSAVAVIACLKDLYEPVRSELNQSAVDRLERNPPVAWLEANRSYPEIEEVVSRRLAWLFDAHGAAYRPDEPTYPIPEHLLRQLDNRRMRDVLQWCHSFQSRCAAAGRIVDDEGDTVTVPPKPPARQDLDQIAAAWNDAMYEPGVDVPSDDAPILELLAAAVQAYGEESDLSVGVPVLGKGVLRVSLAAGGDPVELVVAVTNKNYHRGAFTGQIESLRKRARSASAIAIAVRTLEFPRGEACDRAISQLVKDGGRRAHIDASTLRTLAAFQRFTPGFPAERVLEWRRRDRPISGLPAVAAMFEIERQGVPAPIDDAASGPSQVASEVASVAARLSSAPGSPVAPPRAATPLPIAPLRVEPLGAVPPVVSKRVPSSAAVPSTRPTREPQTVAVPPPPGRPTPPALPVVAPPIVVAPQAAGPVQPPAFDATPRGSAPDLTRAGSAVILPEASRLAAMPPPRSAAPLGTRPPAIDSTELWIGNSPGFQPEPRVLPLGALLQHAAITGGERAANTRLATNLIEQVLEREVAVVVVDRQGELAGYARPDWWQQARDPDRASRLAARLDVRLFTPGMAAGRGLSLPLVPDLSNVPDHERERTVQRSASGLAAMMRLGDGAADAARLSVLTQALVVLAGRGARAGLAELIALIDKQDDALVARAARAGRYDDALFKRVVQNLQSVQVSDAAVFDSEAELLGVDALIGRRLDGKVPLSIVSTRFLGDAPRTQAWVAQLIGCLTRHATAGRSDGIRTALVIDDAELILPATGKAASKEPLQELLKKSQSAALGTVLISQRTAELDVRSRELVATWFLGRMADARSNDKLNPLFERLPPIRSKLAGLERDRFVMLQDGSALDLECGPSLLKIDPLSDPELIALAAKSRSATAPHGAPGLPHDEPGRTGATSPANWAH